MEIIISVTFCMKMNKRKNNGQKKIIKFNLFEKTNKMRETNHIPLSYHSTCHPHLIMYAIRNVKIYHENEL